MARANKGMSKCLQLNDVSDVLVHLHQVSVAEELHVVFQAPMQEADIRSLANLDLVRLRSRKRHGALQDGEKEKNVGQMCHI